MRRCPDPAALVAMVTGVTVSTPVLATYAVEPSGLIVTTLGPGGDGHRCCDRVVGRGDDAHGRGDIVVTETLARSATPSGRRGRYPHRRRSAPSPSSRR